MWSTSKLNMLSTSEYNNKFWFVNIKGEVKFNFSNNFFLAYGFADAFYSVARTG